MRTSRHRSAASRAGLIATPSPRSATYRGVGQQPFPTPRRAVAPNPAAIPEIRQSAAGVLGRGFLPPPRPSSLSGLLPPLARVTAAAAVALGLFFGEAHAMRCGPTSGLAQQLRARFGEEVIRTEVKEDGSAVMQLWVNRNTRTWTMVLSTVRPRMSCIIGAGRDYDGPLPDEGEAL